MGRRGVSHRDDADVVDALALEERRDSDAEDADRGGAPGGPATVRAGYRSQHPAHFVALKLVFATVIAGELTRRLGMGSDTKRRTLLTWTTVGAAQALLLGLAVLAAPAQSASARLVDWSTGQQVLIQQSDVPSYSYTQSGQQLMGSGLGSTIASCSNGDALFGELAKSGPDVSIGTAFSTGPPDVLGGKGVLSAVFHAGSAPAAAGTFSAASNQTWNCVADREVQIGQAQGFSWSNAGTTQLPPADTRGLSTVFQTVTNQTTTDGSNVPYTNYTDFVTIRVGTNLALLLLNDNDGPFPDSERNQLTLLVEQRLETLSPPTSSTGGNSGTTGGAEGAGGRNPPSAKGPSTYVAMGDSYSSGEGSDWPPGGKAQEPGCDWWLYQDPSGSPQNTDHLDNSHQPLGQGTRCWSPAPKDQRGDTCHRSITAYSHDLLRLLGNSPLKLKFVACSGDKLRGLFIGDRGTTDGVNNNNTRQGEHSQLAALDSKTRLVTITIGGNDLKFADYAKTCVTPGNNEWDCMHADPDILKKLGYNTTPNDKNDGTFEPTNSSLSNPPATLSPKNLNSMLGQLDRSLSGLDLNQQLVLVYRTIHKLAPNARILVLGYPRFFQGNNSAAAHFSSQEAQWINERIAVSDYVIHHAAQESGVAQYVDVYDALHGDELGTGDPQFSVQNDGVVSCTGGEYINDVDLAQGAFGSPELLHPNPCGHLREGGLVQQAYELPASTSGSFRLPELPPAGDIVAKNHHGNFPFGCHVTFEAEVNAARAGSVQSYTWFDKTGNQRGTGSTLEMDSVHNDFQLYLMTTGKDKQNRYSFFHGSVC